MSRESSVRKCEVINLNEVYDLMLLARTWCLHRLGNGSGVVVRCVGQKSRKTTHPLSELKSVLLSTAIAAFGASS